MSFFNIVPRDKEYLGYTISSIPLTVIQDDEIEVKPNINIKTNELNDGYVQFYDTGSKGEVFKNIISIIFILKINFIFKNNKTILFLK